MIRHIVLFTVTSAENFDAVLTGLKRLADIPHAHALEVMPNLKRDQLGNAVDVVVHGLFKDEAALEAYKAHPLYAEAISLVRPLRDKRVAVDFITEI